MYTHRFVCCRLISPAAVNHFSSAAVRDFFQLRIWSWVELCQICITLDMDLTRNVSDLPQRYPIFWTNLSTQCSSVHGMLFSSEEECSRGKACGIFSVSGLSVWQMSSDLSDSQAEPQFRNLSGTECTVENTQTLSKLEKKKIKTATLFTNPFTVPFYTFFSI